VVVPTGIRAEGVLPESVEVVIAPSSGATPVITTTLPLTDSFVPTTSAEPVITVTPTRPLTPTATLEAP
jgi:hypothetical protein